MRWTAALCKRKNLGWAWRRVLGSKRHQYIDRPPFIPQALLDRGVDIIDPTAKEEVTWRSPVPDARFPESMGIETHGNYNEQTALLCNPNVTMHMGVKGAACLTKSHVTRGLPPSIQQLYETVMVHENTKQLLQRYIMQALYWNTTCEVLPRRIDARKPGWHFTKQYGIPAKKQACILIRNLLRLCQSYVTSYQSLIERRQIYAPYLNSHYIYKGQPIVIHGLAEWLLTSNRPLPCFADETQVDATVNQALPDLYPILPTIDLQQGHNYSLDHELEIKPGWSHGHLHTVIMTESVFSSDEKRAARALMFCAGYAIAKARHLYGNTLTLPHPICVQGISTDHECFNLVCFQLNTLNFDTDHGVKNLAWVDASNRLFRKILSQPWMPRAIRDERLVDFEPLVFNKLLALYLNGAVELQR